MFSEKMTRIIYDHTSLSAMASKYAGRTMGYCDVKVDDLTTLHYQISELYGKPAGENFVTMINELQVLTASNFLQALELLELNNFIWKSSSVESAQSLPADKDNPGGTLMGVALTFSKAAPSLGEEVEVSNYLRDVFLKKIRRK